MLEYIIGFIIVSLIILFFIYKDVIIQWYTGNAKKTVDDVAKTIGDGVNTTVTFAKSDDVKQALAAAGAGIDAAAADIKKAAETGAAAAVTFAKSEEVQKTIADIGAGATTAGVEIKKAADAAAAQVVTFAESDDTKRVFESAKKDVANVFTNLVSSAKDTVMSLAYDNTRDRHRDCAAATGACDCDCGHCDKCRRYHINHHKSRCSKPSCSCKLVGVTQGPNPQQYINIEYDSADLQVDDNIQGNFNDFDYSEVNYIGESPSSIWYFHQG